MSEKVSLPPYRNFTRVKKIIICFAVRYLQGHKKGLALYTVEGEVDAAVVGALSVPVADDAGQGSTHLLKNNCYLNLCVGVGVVR